MCRNLTIAGHAGWRMPSAAEFATLFDNSIPITTVPRLPAGHPFIIPPSLVGNFGRDFWTSDHFRSPDEILIANIVTGSTGFTDFGDARVLCVRGRH